jgi:hypothetical protein
LSLSKALRRYISLPIASNQLAQLVPGLGGDKLGHDTRVSGHVTSWMVGPHLHFLLPQLVHYHNAEG